LILATLFLVLTLCVISLHYLWSPVYDQQYKAVVDGVETDSVMEIDPGQLIEIFRMGNGSEEVLEGITGIRFAKHQKCYIRTQTRTLPRVTEVQVEDTLVSLETAGQIRVVLDSRVWVPAEEPIINTAFLLNSKIWEICQELPIHWIHPTPLSDAEALEVDTPDSEVIGQRVARDVLNQVPVNDYRDSGIELDSRLDELGYCCQHCRRGYRFCRRYHEPLGGRTICQIVMPCNWWIARMLGRI
uniref:Tenomodulin n=1 Tax=Neogobius melanostomus TaxID=47308 RepID=A0A8C6SMR7_9GOBI